jgi:hypothetical protein
MVKYGKMCNIDCFIVILLFAQNNHIQCLLNHDKYSSPSVIRTVCEEGVIWTTEGKLCDIGNIKKSSLIAKVKLFKVEIIITVIIIIYCNWVFTRWQ